MPSQLETMMRNHDKGKTINILFHDDKPSTDDLIAFTDFLEVIHSSEPHIVITLYYSELAAENLRLAMRLLSGAFEDLSLRFDFCLRPTKGVKLKSALIPEIFTPQLAILDLTSNDLSLGTDLDGLWLPTLLKFAEHLQVLDLSSVSLDRLSTRANHELRYAISKHPSIIQLFTTPKINKGLNAVEDMFEREIQKKLSEGPRELRDATPKPILRALEFHAAAASASAAIVAPIPVRAAQSAPLDVLDELASLESLSAKR